jgi:hypothetical protein
MKNPSLPELPLDAWEATLHTVHLWLQIVGKIRMSLFPKTNHWWHVPLYVSCRGLTTRPIPYQDRLFEIEFDFIDHRLRVQCSDNRNDSFSLGDQSVASFFEKLMQILNTFGIAVHIKAEPYDTPFSNIPFEDDTVHASYDAVAVENYWQLLTFVNTAFEIFRGRFVGKSTPVHLYWHHADLALTRFSGKAAPPIEGGTRADREAYSHEVISFGFWMGDQNIREPAFYAYAYPAPPELMQQPLQPAEATWLTEVGYAFLPYEAIRRVDDPQGKLLSFLETTYQTCATSLNWDINGFARP